VNIFRSAILLLALQTALCADATGFRFKRDIVPSGKGPQALEVDLSLLAGVAPDLHDLRIKDDSGREVPYVVVPQVSAAPIWRPGRMLPLVATKESSGFELDLGTSVRTSRMKLDGIRAPFLKRYHLEGSGDRAHWTELVAEGSLFDLPEDGLKLLEMEIPEGDYRYLRVTWDDRSSARLPMLRGAFVQIVGKGAMPPLAALNVQARPSEPGTSRFLIQLPGPHLPIVALRLQIGGQGPLLREARVLEGRLQNGGLAPRELGAYQLRRMERAGIAAADLRIPIDAPEGSELELRVDDGNNPPLDLKGVQAELAPQPWIYFESDGKPVHAFYGDAKLEAPRYDLAALQDQLKPDQAARAQWGPVSAPPATAQEQAIHDPGPGANLDPSGFKARRTIPDAAPGLAALVLDAHVLSASRGLRDLRILDHENHQIPYLLEERDGPYRVPLTVPTRQAKGRTSEYALDLTEPGLRHGRLVLETQSRVFSRAVQLMEEGPGGTKRILAEALWSHDKPESDAPPLVLSFSGAEGRRVVLTLDEGDNQPLPVSRATLLLPGWRLRFFHPGQGLTLVYDRDIEGPQYDLALLADRLRAAPAKELELAAAGTTPLPKASTPINASGVFWIALVGVMVVLLAILARLLRKPKQEPPFPT
jgi:hypothetical protein